MVNSDVKSSKNTQKKHNYKQTTKIIIIIVVISGIIGIIISLFRNDQQNDTQILTLPLIETDAYSQEDGQYHDVKINISFSTDNKLLEEYNIQQVQDITTEAISDMNYDDMLQLSGLDDIKSQITDYLVVNDENLESSDFTVYIHGIDLGLSSGYVDGLVDDSEKSTNNQTRTKQLESMFGNN